MNPTTNLSRVLHKPFAGSLLSFVGGFQRNLRGLIKARRKPVAVSETSKSRTDIVAGDEAKKSTTVVLFPGLGSNYFGLIDDLLIYPDVVDMFKCASEIFGCDMLQICRQGPTTELQRSIGSQAAIFLISLALIQKLRSVNPDILDRCQCTAGFGIGELAALVFTGSLTFVDALNIVKIRANELDNASLTVPSFLMTIKVYHSSKLSLAMRTAKEFCQRKLNIVNPVCSVAMYLYPECKVIGGNKEALQFIAHNKDIFKLDSVKYLPVSGAYHTSLMRRCTKSLAKALQNVNVLSPKVPIYFNATGKTCDNPNEIKKLIVNQVHRPVLWEQTMNSIYANCKEVGFPKTYECGTGSELGFLLKKTNSLAYSNYFKLL